MTRVWSTDWTFFCLKKALFAVPARYPIDSVDLCFARCQEEVAPSRGLSEFALLVDL